VILLDTHALLWMASDPKRLSRRAHEAIRDARQRTGIAVATITLWEIAWLAASPAHPGRRERGIVCARDCGAGHSQASDGGNHGSRRKAARTVSQRSGRPPDRFDGHGRGHATDDRGCADSAVKGVGYGLAGGGIRYGSSGPLSLGPPDSRGRRSQHSFLLCPHIHVAGRVGSTSARL
jgi:hypothetical protein